MLEKLIIINAPIVFKGVWNIVKYWVDSKTRKKIEIYWSNDTETLLKYIDRSKLYHKFGGNCQDEILNNPGPWEIDFQDSLRNNNFFYKNPIPWKKYFLRKDEIENEK